MTFYSILYIYSLPLNENVGSKSDITMFNTFVHVSFQLHLYDVDVPGKIKFQESEFLAPGNEFFTFETGNLATDT